MNSTNTAFDVNLALEEYEKSLLVYDLGQVAKTTQERDDLIAKAKEEYVKATEQKDLTPEQLKDAAAVKKAKINAIKAEYNPLIKSAKQELALTKKRAKILVSAKKAEYEAWEKAGLDLATTESKVENLNDDSFKEELVNDNVLLSVRHLKQYFTSGYGANKMRTKAVHDISFDIHKGEVFGLVGESGCGKTTTGRSLIRLYDITSGNVYYKGHRISGGTRWNEKEIGRASCRERV